MHAFMIQIWTWLWAHPLAGGLVAVVVALLFWKQPRQTLKLALAIMVLVALGYLVSGIVNFTMDSAVVKDRMIEKGQ
jgi:hypothetical protein